MSEYLPAILGVFVVIAVVRIFWPALARLGGESPEYEQRRQQIEKRKRELGIEDESQPEPQKKKVGFFRGLLEIILGFAFFMVLIIVCLRVFGVLVI